MYNIFKGRSNRGSHHRLSQYYCDNSETCAEFKQTVNSPMIINSIYQNLEHFKNCMSNVEPGYNTGNQCQYYIYNVSLLIEHLPSKLKTEFSNMLNEIQSTYPST